jgi:Protein of unknown function (DUF2970)
MSESDHKLPENAPPGFLRIVLAVFWSFFGVRKGRDLLADAASIKPQHLIVAGVLGGAFVVFSLLLLVRFIIKSVGA